MVDGVGGATRGEVANALAARGKAKVAYQFLGTDPLGSCELRLRDLSTEISKVATKHFDGAGMA